ncbi:metallophosphoesterase [Rhizosaccharibacter radicis]|uniref:Metallophosphoesterase n=1 Tax=Rhizosaccharibacter radicis TaxID=2782605 RepID=A0ABT1VZG4_9PROT|nr:metallophosphoesterase [Acetobacteraceae bacterium KSS12]
MKPLRRRDLLGAGAALAAIPGRNAAAAPGDAADLTLILMGDLHSGYRWSSRLLRAVRDEVSQASGEVRIVVNGDVFERNNLLAVRTDGAVDLALLRGFTSLAPTIVTIGNHDSDLFDPAIFAGRVADTGAVLLSDITDGRTGRPYGPASQRILVRGHPVVFAAIGTPDLSLYPPAWRSAYRVPDPGAYGRDRLPALFGDAALPVALVHAGFLADRTILPFLRPPFLLHGSHDHLRFAQRFGDPDPDAPGGLHLHSGAWSSAFQVLTVRFREGVPVLAVRDVLLAEASPEDAGLARLLATRRAAALQPRDVAAIGTLDRAMPLDEAVGWAAGRVKQAAGADIGLLSHTTFGDGLPAGTVTADDLRAFLRFDGKVAVGEIPRARLPALLARCNQFDGSTPYARRTGDYLYATAPPAGTGDTVSVAINAYAVSDATKRRDFLGWDAPGFTPRPDLMLGAIITRGLAA